MKIKPVVYLFFYLLIVVHPSSGQGLQDDSLIYRKLVDTTIRVHANALGPNIHLYNGFEYVNQYHKVTGHPFYETDQMQPGSIFYDGVLYNNIPFLFDLVKEQVVIEGAIQNFRISLVPAKISYFTLSGHLFTRITVDTLKDVIPPGFYDLAYNGEIKVLVKRRKQVVRSLKAEDPSKITSYDSYYLKKGNEYFHVDSRKSLLSLFTGEEESMKKYYRKNKLKFRRDAEKVILSTVQHYDLLKK